MSLITTRRRRSAVYIDDKLIAAVEQDRLAAIRAALGSAPSLIPVMSHVEDFATGNTRNGQSDVTTDEFVPLISFSPTVGNIDTTIDQIGGGSSRLRWIITGHRANGDPWTLDRVNRFAHLFDISVGSADELAGQLFTIEQNKFEDAPRNNDLIADLVFFGESGETATSTSERLDRVIFGSFKIEVSVQ